MDRQLPLKAGSLPHVLESSRPYHDWSGKKANVNMMKIIEITMTKDAFFPVHTGIGISTNKQQYISSFFEPTIDKL